MGAQLQHAASIAPLPARTNTVHNASLMRSYALILAGGGGTRLWPASRKRRPKQFLPLLDDNQTLLGATVARLAPLFPLD